MRLAAERDGSAFRAGRQPRTDGIAGLDIEFVAEPKIRTAHVDRYSVVKEVVIENEIPEIGNHQWQAVGQRKEFLGDQEADRIVVDDRQLLAETGQSGGEVSAAASQDEDVCRMMQQLIHELEVTEDALAVGRRLALPDTLLEVNSRSIRGAFDDLDRAVPALIAPQQPHLMSPCIK